jgi:hypothetical protein
MLVQERIREIDKVCNLFMNNKIKINFTSNTLKKELFLHLLLNNPVAPY